MNEFFYRDNLKLTNRDKLKMYLYCLEQVSSFNSLYICPHITAWIAINKGKGINIYQIRHYKEDFKELLVYQKPENDVWFSTKKQRIKALSKIINELQTEINKS